MNSLCHAFRLLERNARKVNMKTLEDAYSLENIVEWYDKGIFLRNQSMYNHIVAGKHRKPLFYHFRCTCIVLRDSVSYFGFALFLYLMYTMYLKKLYK